MSSMHEISESGIELMEESSVEQQNVLVYLAGPIRHGTDGGHAWRDDVCNQYPHEQSGIEWLNPLDKYDVHAADVTVVIEDSPGEADTEGDSITVSNLVETDKGLIQRADAVLVGWEPVVSVGTPMEMYLAYITGMPLVVWNRHDVDVSPWMQYHADVILGDVDACVTWLQDRLVDDD